MNAQAENVLNAMKVLVATHAQIRIDRVTSVGNLVHTKLGKELIKEKRDIHGKLPEPTEFLLGEHLGD